MRNTKRIEEAYTIAKEQYASLGVDISVLGKKTG